MHDWTLKGIRFVWGESKATLEFEDTTFSTRVLVAEGVQELHVPRANEWGPSVSVNEVSAVELISSGAQRIRIEMQSGDTITIVAKHFLLPAS